jgi:hypothetical protein
MPSAMTSAVPSRRASWASSSAPNVDSPSLPQVPESQESSFYPEANAIDEDDESSITERKASIYLDAQEEDPSVADILRELRELPDNLLCESAISDEHGSTIIETRHAATPTLLQPSSAESVPPAMATSQATAPASRPRSISAHRRGRRRSGLRHSFSSAIRVSARTDGEREAKGAKADAVVELHEESASAFQDFLFWCYPQYVRGSHVV